MTTSATVRERLIANPSRSATVGQIVELLESEETRAVSELPAITTVSEALRLWRTRLQNTQLAAAPLRGVQDLLVQLEQLAPQRQVEQFGFVSPDVAMAVFFTHAGGVYLGSALIDREKQESELARSA